MKKYFVFSDIHGNLKPLVEALEKKGFDVDNKDHYLISLGDNFDRGIENLKVLGFLKYFDRMNRLIMILGNHDEFLLNFLNGTDNGLFNVKYNGMGNTLVELADKESNTMDKIKTSILNKYPFILELLNKMKDKFELGNKIFLHAGFSHHNDKGWYIHNFVKKPDFMNEFKNNGKTYIFGHFHTSVLNKHILNIDSNEVFRYLNFIGIDANTVLTKHVHVLVFDDLGNEIN